MSVAYFTRLQKFVAHLRLVKNAFVEVGLYGWYMDAILWRMVRTPYYGRIVVEVIQILWHFSHKSYACPILRPNILPAVPYYSL